MPINETKRLRGAKQNFNLEINSSITWIELLKLYLFKLHRGLKKSTFPNSFWSFKKRKVLSVEPDKSRFQCQIYLPKNSPASFVRGINTVVRFIFVYDSVRYPYDPVKLFEFLKVRKYHSLLSSPLRRNFDLICVTKKLATSFI